MEIKPGYFRYDPSVWRDVIDNMVYVDVGAHVGSTVQRTLRKYPSLKVIAIEPYPKHFKKLSQLNVTTINCGCWSELGVRTIYSTGDGWNGGCSFFQRSDTLPTGISVPVDTLDNILRRYNVVADLVKIDTEGSEAEVLGGFTPKRGTQFHVECHSNLEDVLSVLLRRKPEKLTIGIGDETDPGGGWKSSVHGVF